MWCLSVVLSIFGGLSSMQLVGGKTIGLDARSNKYMFPEDFMFGVSTAAYQTEGAWNEEGKGENIWDTFLHKHVNYTKDGLNGDIASDSYHKYLEDIDMIKNLGVRYYRTSISWPRILPNGTVHNINKEGVVFYRRFFKALLRAKITPIITLYHWDLPTNLMDLGGWCNPKMVDFFEDYARVAFHLFGDLIKLWLTLNEPHQHCTTAYARSELVPGLSSPGIGFYFCAHHMLLAHARAYRLYDREFRYYQKGKVSIPLDCNWSEPKTGSREDRKAAERHLEMHVGLFAHPIFSKIGDYPAIVRKIVDSASHAEGFFRSRLPYFTPEEIKALLGSYDFFSLNHYTTLLISASTGEEKYIVPSYDNDVNVKQEQNPLWATPGASWLSVYPPGFRNIINWITKKYGNSFPIIVTENGLADYGQIEDYARVSYYNEYLHQLLLAINEDGCNVKGYFAWSLLDNFEWTDGYTTKFGLYHVDFTSPERTRTPKLSAKSYSNIVRTRKIDFDYIKIPKNFSKYFD